MEDPLLTPGTPSGGRGKDRIFRRSDALTYGSSYQKAAALVDLAEDGIGLPEQILDQSSFQTAAKSYFVFIKLDLIWSLSYFALVALNFFEKPLWCQQNPALSCNDREYYYLGQLPYLTGLETLIIEAAIVIVLIVHTFFPLYYEGHQIYWRNTVTQLKVTCLLILVVDMLLYTLYVSPAAFNFLPFRLAPYIRVVILILNIRDLRASILILAGMLGTYLNILALWLLFLLFASWVAYVMFEDTQQGKLVFTSYGTTLYEMFVLFTTSNNPDVWIPAYKVSRWYSIFFVLYVLIGVYFVTNLILAVVYDSFKSELAKQVSGMDRMKTRMLGKAFDLIDKHKTGFIDKPQCISLFEELTNYRTLPKISTEEFELIFTELDDTGDFKINKDEFADLCHAIALRFQKEDTLSYFEYCPSIYHSNISKVLKDFVRSPYFGYGVSFVLLLNLIAVIIETTLDIEENSGQKVWQAVEFVFGNIAWTFLTYQLLCDVTASLSTGLTTFIHYYIAGWIYMLEMALKVYAFGFENYWRDGQNRFDFLVTWIIVIGETLTYVTPDNQMFFSNGEWIRYLLLARMLRLIRLLMHVGQYRAFISTFLTLIPSLMPYLGTIFCVMCIYCSLGIQLFGGIVNAGNPKLEATDLADNDYLLFNFNDYPNGMVTLFNLLVMGNWQAWMQSYTKLTGTSWTLAYFVSFFIITVLLLLNLVVAFVLEAFFTEMDLEAAEKCENQSGAGSGRDRPNRYAGSKSRSQRVDVLLHHMLSSELQSSCPNNP